MIWIDGEYFEPIYYGSLVELTMIHQNDKAKLFDIIGKELGVYLVLDKIIKLLG